MPQAAFLRAPTSYGFPKTIPLRDSRDLLDLLYFGVTDVLQFRSSADFERHNVDSKSGWCQRNRTLFPPHCLVLEPQTRGSSSDHPSWKVPENQKSNHQVTKHFFLLLPCHHFFIHHLPLFCLFRWSPAPSLNTRPLLGGPRLCPVGFPQPNVNELRQGFH